MPPWVCGRCINSGICLPGWGRRVLTVVYASLGVCEGYLCAKSLSPMVGRYLCAKSLSLLYPFHCWSVMSACYRSSLSDIKDGTGSKRGLFPPFSRFTVGQ